MKKPPKKRQSKSKELQPIIAIPPDLVVANENPLEEGPDGAYYHHLFHKDCYLCERECCTQKVMVNESGIDIIIHGWLRH